MKLKILCTERLSGELDYEGIYDTEKKAWDNPHRPNHLHTAHYNIVIEEVNTP